MLAGWILEELQAIRAPNKVTPEEADELLKRWSDETGGAKDEDNP